MKYVAYHRVSTKRQGESGLGIQGQQAIIRHFVRDGEIIAEFTEVASGGSMLKRPKLREAIDLVKKENATLVVAKADRLSRNALDALTLYDEIEKRLMCCDIPGMEKMMLQMAFAFAERERDIGIIRTKTSLQAKRVREGKQIINGAPYHKKKVNFDEILKKARQAQTDKSRAKNKQQIILAKKFRREGWTYKKIADLLNEMEFTTSKGCKFQPTQVHNFLKG